MPSHRFLLFLNLYTRLFANHISHCPVPSSCLATIMINVLQCEPELHQTEAEPPRVWSETELIFADGCRGGQCSVCALFLRNTGAVYGLHNYRLQVIIFKMALNNWLQDVGEWTKTEENIIICWNKWGLNAPELIIMGRLSMHLMVSLHAKRKAKKIGLSVNFGM